MGKFELFLDHFGQYRFRLKAVNGQIILASEGYTAKADAQRGVVAVIQQAPSDTNYQYNRTNAGWSFNLKGANGAIIGTSEVYNSAAGRDNGVEDVKREAPQAATADLT